MAASASLIPPTPSADAYGAQEDRPLIPEAGEPIALFGQWLGEARAGEISDANAMTLATVDADGLPDARIVLLKDFSEDGFTFYTNLGSAKAGQLAKNGAAALLFHWKSNERQVRLRGRVVPVSPKAADAYFAERARESQIGAWASDQSRPLASRGALEARVALFTETYSDEEKVPRPPYWGGYCLVPSSIEFWQSQAYRLHDRRLYSYDAASKGWSQQRLNP
ncbi:MAG: pyridoxamine 5'-phosphate oxidase [Pseudomonadota bacterium]